MCILIRLAYTPIYIYLYLFPRRPIDSISLRVFWSFKSFFPKLEILLLEYQTQVLIQSIALGTLFGHKERKQCD
jgi:hypothetical protein